MLADPRVNVTNGVPTGCQPAFGDDCEPFVLPSHGEMPF